jgi:hypothetical protein
VKIRLGSALRNFLHKKELEKDLDAEVSAFVEMVAEEKFAAGVLKQKGRPRPNAEVWSR